MRTAAAAVVQPKAVSWTTHKVYYMRFKCNEKCRCHCQGTNILLHLNSLFLFSFQREQERNTRKKAVTVMMMMIMSPYNVIYLLSFIPKARKAKKHFIYIFERFFCTWSFQSDQHSNVIKVYTMLLKILWCVRVGSFCRNSIVKFPRIVFRVFKEIFQRTTSVPAFFSRTQMKMWFFEPNSRVRWDSWNAFSYKKSIHSLSGLIALGDKCCASVFLKRSKDSVLFEC